MPRVRDLLYRFRPAGTPGAAGQAGVPADRAAETAAELEPLFARLADTEQECREILAQARRDAAQIRELGLRQAQAVVGDAGGRGEVERTMTAAQLSQDGEREADTERRRAEAAVSALHQRAADEGARLRGHRRRPGGEPDRRAPTRRPCQPGRGPMSAAWVAGSVRARAMTRRRLGRAAARTPWPSTRTWPPPWPPSPARRTATGLAHRRRPSSRPSDPWSRAWSGTPGCWPAGCLARAPRSCACSSVRSRRRTSPTTSSDSPAVRRPSPSSSAAWPRPGRGCRPPGPPRSCAARSRPPPGAIPAGRRRKRSGRPWRPCSRTT